MRCPHGRFSAALSGSVIRAGRRRNPAPHAGFGLVDTTRPTGFEPVTFGFVDAPSIPVESGWLEIRPLRAGLERRPGGSVPVESGHVPYHLVPTAATPIAI